MNRSDFEDWVFIMRANIAAASIARQCHDMIRDGKGAPKVEDMRRFSEEAGATADLWEESWR